MTASLCGTSPAFGNAYIVIDPECPCSGAFVFATSFDNTSCGDGNWSMFYNGLPAGEYWTPVLKDGTSTGPYTWNISAGEGPPPPMVCGPGNGDCCTEGGPARLKRCGLEMRLVIPAGGPQELTARPDNTLIKALIRARRWKEQLLTGSAPSIQAIANEEGVSERYLSRVLRLAFLAPDITEAILDGYQPPELGLDKVLRGVPLTWADQRQLFRTRDIS